MKIIKTNNKVVYPPVKIKCGCGSIILIEEGDAVLNEHNVWEWYCPVCKKNKKSGSAWQLQIVG